MYYHALHVIFFFFLVPYVSIVTLSLSSSLSLSLSLSLSRLVSLSWHLKNLFLLKTRFVVVLLLFLFPLILFSFMMKRHVVTSLRTSLTRRFIRNARSFCLISRTLLYPVLLALGDELLFVRNPRGVPACSFRSFTPTCTPLIPSYQGLLQYFEVHVS